MNQCSTLIIKECSENHNEITLHIHWNVYNKKTITIAGEDVDKVEPIYIARGNVK